LDIDGQRRSLVACIRDVDQDVMRQLSLHIEIPFLCIRAAVVMVDADQVLAQQRVQTEAAAGGLVDSLRERIAQIVGGRDAAIQRTGESGRDEEARGSEIRTLVVTVEGRKNSPYPPRTTVFGRML